MVNTLKMSRRKPVRQLSPASSSSSSSAEGTSGSWGKTGAALTSGELMNAQLDDEEEDSEEEDGSGEEEEDSEEDDFAPERAAVQQYVGESDLEDALAFSSDEEEDDGGRNAKGKRVAGPSQLSFAERLKAQKKARRSQARSSTLGGPPARTLHDETPGSGDEGARPTPGRRGRLAPRHDHALPSSRPSSASKSPKLPLPHRSDKHAPRIQSSKRPVPRFRLLDATDPSGPGSVFQPRWDASKSRDPRFDPLSGAVRAELVKRSYGFLDDQRSRELAEMKVALAKAKGKRGKGKVGGGGGGGQVTREERERLEEAVKRMENREVETRRKEGEDEARRKWKREEREKRAQGKGAFYLKKKEEKTLVLQDRYDNLLKTDKRQLHKSLERKRKKEAAKGKKAMPPPRASASA